MKRFTIAIISTLFIAASPKAIAELAEGIASQSTNLVTKDITKSTYLAQTSPANLVNLADRGYFSDRGIPSSQALISAYSLGNISAEKLVQVGVETGRISPNMLKERKYISAVESMLNNLKTR